MKMVSDRKEEKRKMEKRKRQQLQARKERDYEEGLKEIKKILSQAKGLAKGQELNSS